LSFLLIDASGLICELSSSPEGATQTLHCKGTKPTQPLPGEAGGDHVERGPHARAGGGRRR
jgi:hypothetical protein